MFATLCDGGDVKGITSWMIVPEESDGQGVEGGRGCGGESVNTDIFGIRSGDKEVNPLFDFFGVYYNG